MFETVFTGLLTKTSIIRVRNLGSAIPLTDGARAYSANMRQKKGPVYLLRQKIAEGQFNSDDGQFIVANALQEVYDNIIDYTPKKFLLSKPPKGLYIYGSVGVGKTMLMDLFFQSVKTSSKKRAHFDDFMADVHSRIHRVREKGKKTKAMTGNLSNSNPITAVAKQLVKEVWLLCVDEFQVTNVADAMIIKRLFTEMFDCGLVMVATSNRSPDDLYKDGLQRSTFSPFIPLLKKHCDVINIYREDSRSELSNVLKEKYFLTGQEETETDIDAAFEELCFIEKEKPGPKTLKILNRDISFSQTCGRILFASFHELCERPLSSNDYIQIAKNFTVVFIKNIPKMNLENRNQVRRFITLIDTLYDNKVRVILSAEDRPEALFSASWASVSNEAQKKQIIKDLNAKTESKTTQNKSYSGSEEVFAFQRTVSRIKEMCSDNYWESCKSFNVLIPGGTLRRLNIETTSKESDKKNVFSCVE